MKHEGFTPGPPCTRCGLPNLPEESGTCAACIDLEEADCIAEDDGRLPEGGTVGAELLVALRRSGRENASLLAENERLRDALWFSLNTLRLMRDGYPAAWDSFMASEAGPDMATVWDKLKAALAGREEG